MGNRVYITEWKSMNLKDMPTDWKVYHYSPTCPHLVNNPMRHNSNVVEKDDAELDSLGYRCCNDQACLAAGFERGLFEEEDPESGKSDQLTEEEIAKELALRALGLTPRSTPWPKTKSHW